MTSFWAVVSPSKLSSIVFSILTKMYLGQVLQVALL